MSDEPVDVPAEGVIDYYHFVVDPGWTEDKWIMAAEAKPGSLETVHHILVFVAPPGAGSGRATGRVANGDRLGQCRGRAVRDGANAVASAAATERRGGGGGEGAA